MAALSTPHVDKQFLHTVIRFAKDYLQEHNSAWEIGTEFISSFDVVNLLDLFSLTSVRLVGRCFGTFVLILRSLQAAEINSYGTSIKQNQAMINVFIIRIH